MALPGLATLLDPDAFHARLRLSVPGLDLRATTPHYIRYKPGVNCLVAYHLDIAGTPVEGYAKAYRVDDPKLATAHRRRATDGLLGRGRIMLSEIAAEVMIFPNDDKLPGLANMCSAERQQALLSRLLPGPTDLNGARLEALRYKPERRCVMRLTTDDAFEAVVKFYTEDRFEAAQRGPLTFTSGGLLHVARMLGQSRRHHTIAFEWLPGRPFDEVVRDPMLSLHQVESVGEALAALHSHEVFGLPDRELRDEASDLVAACEALAAVCPVVAEPATWIATTICADLERERAQRRPTHGDFYAKQVVMSDEKVGILDLDRVARADPASDIGTFVAHLERSVVCGEMSRQRAENVSAALLDGYSRAAPSYAPERIAPYVAANLVKLAIEPFRYFEPDWPDRVVALVERAELIAHTHRAQRRRLPSVLAVM